MTTHALIECPAPGCLAELGTARAQATAVTSQSMLSTSPAVDVSRFSMPGSSPRTNGRTTTSAVTNPSRQRRRISARRSSTGAKAGAASCLAFLRRDVTAIL